MSIVALIAILRLNPPKTRATEERSSVKRARYLRLFSE